MKRIVCDTNILVSGLLWRGAPRLILSGIETGLVILFTSRPLLEELERVLTYPKIGRIFKKTGVERREVFRWVLEHATLVAPKPFFAPVIRDDPSDDHVLACAVAAAADGIVSGDRHLLALGAFRGIPILTAANFNRTARL